MKKNNSETYHTLCTKIGVEPDKVIYIDDKQAQVDIAKEAGLQSFQHVSNDETLKRFGKLGIRN